MLKDVDAVIFDLDGTIIDSMWIWKKVDEDFLSCRSIPMPDDLHKEIEGMSFTDTAKYFKERFSLEDAIDSIKEEWIRMVKNHYENTIKLKDGVYEFIRRIKDNNIKVGLATSNFRDLSEAVLKKNKIYGFFDCIVTTCEVDKDKSFPDVFLMAAEKLNTVPSKCIVFEDTVTGIIGAKKAGMKVIGVQDKHSIKYKDEIINLADGYIESFHKQFL